MDPSAPEPTADRPDDDSTGVPTGEQSRLWTPWRMRYVGGGTKETGCLFCNRLGAADDVRSLILFRGRHVFGIMNLFPYNTGHLMLVPNQHAASPEEAPAEALVELSLVLRPVLRALRRVLGCDGFNVGFNVGAVAGAGVAEHLHQHVVPRWTGDANFMPILAATMVMPELIPVTYAKLRAELERELIADDGETPVPRSSVVRSVVLPADRDAVLAIERSGGLKLPTAEAGPDEALWRGALRAAADVAGGADLAGWAGPARAGSTGSVAFTLLARGPEAVAKPASGSAWVSVDRVEKLMTDPADQHVVRQALSHLTLDPQS
jgi:ATP adenylyltransferase